MRLRLLGPLELTGDDGALALGGRKQRSVLAVLALSANRVVSVERLVAGVWGEDASERAGSTLQVYVSNLRKILRTDGAGSMTIDGLRPGYMLSIPESDLDVLEFARLVRSARDAIAASRVESGAGLLHEALSLWRGDALADLAGEPFTEAEAVRLDQGRLAALEERIEADLTLGRHREVVAELERLVAEHPLRERLWGQLIVALYRADRQSDALAAFGRARRLLAEELGIDPGPALRELERAILHQDLDPGPPGLRSAPVVAPVRLPTPIGRTVGRDDEVAALAGMLAGHTRMITLTGPGGSGKTRLLIELARTVADEFAGGVYFVDLTALTESSQVVPAITRALGGTETNTQGAAEAAVDALANREALLALDNFEHVLAAGPDVAALLHSVSGLRVVVSSQTPLRLADEVEYRVSGLATPPPGAGLTSIGSAEAVRLFVTRARAARPDFALAPANAELVAEICRRLDGLPLGIELAAARLRMLSLEALYSRLDDSLNLLTSGNRDAPLRQRTLRAAIQWSVDLLDAGARDALGELGVFGGEFDLDAALAVCGDESGFETLVENSLVRVAGGAGDPRFRMLEAVRQYARDQLLTAGQRDLATSRFIEHYLTAAERAHELIDGPRAVDAAIAVERQQANFHLALRAALDQDDAAAAARIAVALAPLWQVLGQAAQARRDLDAVLDAGGSGPHDAAVRAAAGRLAYQNNDLDRARELFDASLVDAPGRAPLAAGEAALVRCLLAAIDTSGGRTEGDAAARAALAEAEDGGFYPARVVGRSVLAIAAARRGDFALEKELYEQRLLIARHQDDSARVADTLTVLGEIAFDEQDYPTASALVREAFELSDGYSRPESRDALIMLGRIAVADRDPERAFGFLDEALRRSVDVGQPAALALCLRAHAAAAVLQGDSGRAARLFGAGDALQPASMPVNANVERDLAERRAECERLLGETGFGREYRQGAAMDPSRAIALAVRPAAPSLVG